MSASFILLLAASVIFRFLAVKAGSAFDARLRLLLPGNIAGGAIETLFSRFPHRIAEFRTGVLPMRAGRIGLDALCCGSLLAAIWACPPSFLAGVELATLQYAGSAVVAVAALADGVSFARMLSGAVRAEAAVSKAAPKEPAEND